MKRSNKTFLSKPISEDLASDNVDKSFYKDFDVEPP